MPRKIFIFALVLCLLSNAGNFGVIIQLGLQLYNLILMFLQKLKKIRAQTQMEPSLNTAEVFVLRDRPAQYPSSNKRDKNLDW